MTPIIKFFNYSRCGPIRTLELATLEYNHRNPHDKINRRKAKFAEEQAFKKLRAALAGEVGQVQEMETA